MNTFSIDYGNTISFLINIDVKKIINLPKKCNCVNFQLFQPWKICIYDAVKCE